MINNYNDNLISTERQINSGSLGAPHPESSEEQQ